MWNVCWHTIVYNHTSRSKIILVENHDRHVEAFPACSPCGVLLHTYMITADVVCESHSARRLCWNRPDLDPTLSHLFPSWIAVHCIALYCIVLDCIALYFIAVHTVSHTFPLCITLHCSLHWCTSPFVLHWNFPLVLHSTAAYIATPILATDAIALYCIFIQTHCQTFPCIAMCCVATLVYHQTANTIETLRQSSTGESGSRVQQWHYDSHLLWWRELESSV